MLPVTHVFLFGSGEGTDDHDAARLDRAMMLDTAERLSANPRVHVTVHDTPGRGDGADVPPECARIGGTVPVQIEDAVRGFYERHESGVLIVLLGRNPLWNPAEIDRIAVALDQEDDAVAFAFGGSGDAPPIAVIGTRRHHPGLYRAAGAGGGAAQLRVLVAAEAMLVPLRPVRAVHGPADYVWLLHEVEREDLLGHAVPRRTFDVLQRMKRQFRIPESP